MARIRSPNYPQLSLPAAIERIGRVFVKEHQHPAPKDVVAQHLGYRGLNGASLGVISALLKYGLLEQDGESFRVADRALAILHPSSADEKQSALRDAATTPVLFRELREQFGEHIPSDENLKAYLVRRGFGHNALTGVIQVYRETAEMVELEGKSGAVVPSLPAPVPAPAGPETRPKQSAIRFVEMPRNVPVMSVSWEGDTLRVEAILKDQASVTRLIRALTANKELLPEEAKEQDPDLQP